jgi:hypothetical protein
MRWRVSFSALVVVASATVMAQGPGASTRSSSPAPRAQSTALPVRRVVLYKTGVGYFEHLGNVRNRQDVAVRFTSAQLNDVLKSLTAIDLGAGQVTGISYNSIAPIDQRLGALRLPVGSAATRIELLTALRGARVEVSSGASAVTGRLLSVERRTREKNGETIDVDTVSVVSDTGDVRSFELTSALRVRIVDGDLRQEISRYLDVVGSAREQDVRQMVISTSGTGDRSLFVSYISEVPIWKTTYRLVLRDKGAKPLLQGWAIVDNTIGEDWKDVELSLVAGAPQSFIQNVSQPYYGRRPTVALPQAALLTPQTHQAGLRVQEPAGSSAATDFSATRTRDEVQSRSSRLLEGGSAGGTVGGVVGGLPQPPPPPPRPVAEPFPRALEMSARMQIAPAAVAAPIGDLFEYRIKEPVTLQKNQSALVPIVSAEITAEKVALWNRAPGTGRPLRAVWITNGSGLTLDGGSIAVIDGNAFAGEGLIEPLKAGERRLLSYAADVGLIVDAKLESAPSRLLRVRARDGIVIQETEERSTWTYTVRSEEDQPVTLIVEHRLRQGWNLGKGQVPAESTPDAHRFRLVVDPKKEATLVVREMRATDLQVGVAEFSDGHIAQLAAAGGSTEALQRALAPIFAKRSELAVFDRQLAVLEQQQNTIVQDQQRLRENMKALRGSSEEKQLLQRYTRQLDDQENRLEALRREMAETAKRRDATREELSLLIANFTYEA